MPILHAASALLPQGWAHDVRLTLEHGQLSAIEIGVPAAAGDECHAVLVPGMPNLHSHAHQRGMAGLAEWRGASTDSFWSWRELMYRFALAMTPAQLEAIASQLYVEMLEAGFTRVGEFHYLHHDPDGRAYADPAEMAARLAAAATCSGIGLTLLPVFYAHAGFGGTPAAAAQRRFINAIDAYARLLDASRRAVKNLPGAIVGVAPHSLRAVTPDELAQVLVLADGAPVHIHIAEQVQEVEACIAWSGARPVQWLLDHAPVDERWCLVHATHIDADETRRTAVSGAVVGLCPITEANLGDGIFDAPPFVDAGGHWGIGSDSNVQIGVADELRLLEYSQRLARRERNVMAGPGGSTGRTLFGAALTGGSRALGQRRQTAVGLAVGAPADLVSLRARQTSHTARGSDTTLDAWIFSGAAQVDCVWRAGVRLVTDGRHAMRDAVARDFIAALDALKRA